MANFAIKILMADAGKPLAALIAVTFSFVLINLQGGLFFGLMSKATVLIDRCDADIWICHRGTEAIDFAQNIPVSWLNRVKGLPEVEFVAPHIIGNGVATLNHGGFEYVWVVGVDPSETIGLPLSVLTGDVRKLLRSGGVSFDLSDSRKLGYPAVGDLLEINGYRAKLVAATEATQSFVTTPLMFTSIHSAREFTGIPSGFCSFGICKVRPGSDLDSVAQRIRELIPHADVLTTEALRGVSKDYWMKRTGIGLSFGAATLLGLLVGLIIVSQSLYGLIVDHICDFAALKAIGAENSTVSAVVLIQTLLIASVGVLLGLGIVWAAETFASTPITPIIIPPLLRTGAVAVVFVISLLATVLPLRRLRMVDPIMVLQG